MTPIDDTGWHWTLRPIMAGAGIWVAGNLVHGFHLGGGAGQQVLVVLIAAALWELPTFLVLLVARVAPSFGDILLDFLLPQRVLPLVWGPLSLWISAGLCGALGLALRLTGFWPAVTAALVVIAARFVLETVTSLRLLARFVVFLGVMSLAVTILDGVRLDDGPWWRRLLTMTVLAVGFFMADPVVPAPAHRLVSTFLLLFAVTTAGHMLLLWLVSWFSTGLHLNLQVSGSGAFLLAGLSTAAAMWIASLPDLRRVDQPQSSTQSNGGVVTTSVLIPETYGVSVLIPGFTIISATGTSWTSGAMVGSGGMSYVADSPWFLWRLT